MKLSFAGLVVAMCLYQQSLGCDACGCTASNQFMGMLPAYQYNFAGLQYLHTSYSGVHQSAYSGRPSSTSADYYNTMQAWGRYKLAGNYQIFAFIPYQYNVHEQNGIRTSWAGIGDISILATRKLWTRNKVSNQLFVAGAGIKLPTGRHTGTQETDKLGLPNMQPGTGATDILLSAYYNRTKDDWALTADATYTLTTTSPGSYKYGNRLTSAVLASHTFTIKKVSLQPLAGIRAEYGLHDYDNYQRRWLNEDSGGYMLFAAGGVQAYYGKTGVRATCQLPIAQYYSAGNVTAGYKLEAGVFYLF